MRRIGQQGFTLLELSIVLLVFSLMLSGILTVVTQKMRVARENELTQKLERIKTAMLNYRKANDRLPCPGDLTIKVQSTNFGMEGDAPGDCNSGTPAANFADAGETVFGGAVPVRTLKLPDEYAFDPWGNHFTYVVDARITASSSPFKTYPPTSTSIGNLTVKYSADSTYTTRALYLVISHGPNGHGAYTASGTRRSSGSTNTAEQTNCHCDNTGASTAFEAVFYAHPLITTSASALNSFDDTVMFVDRNGLLSAAEENTESW